MYFLTKQLVRYIQTSILLYFIRTTHASPSVEINCTFEIQNWSVLSIGVIYECECKKSIQVTERDTIVSNVTGIHVEHLNNSNVQGIHIIGASYLPKGIEKFFPNLVGLSLEQHLKELTQNDLKPFTKLQHFWVARNLLEVIEKDLFKYNPELTYISLKHNFIKQIDPNVFDHLVKLKILELSRNDCIDDDAVGIDAVHKLIEQSIEKCVPVPGQSMPSISEAEILINENNSLNEKLWFWRNCTIFLWCLGVIIGVLISIKKYNENGGFKFVFFRNSD